jgi:hypothetical protein
MNERGKASLPAQSVLRRHRDVAERRIRPDPVADGVLAAAGEPAAVKMNGRHPLLFPGWRPEDIQLQIESPPLPNTTFFSTVTPASAVCGTCPAAAITAGEAAPASAAPTKRRLVTRVMMPTPI